jgi:hypothetical protein
VLQPISAPQRVPPAYQKKNITFRAIQSHDLQNQHWMLETLFEHKLHIKQAQIRQIRDSLVAS